MSTSYFLQETSYSSTMFILFLTDFIRHISSSYSTILWNISFFVIFLKIWFQITSWSVSCRYLSHIKVLINFLMVVVQSGYFLLVLLYIFIQDCPYSLSYFLFGILPLNIQLRIPVLICMVSIIDYNSNLKFWRELFSKIWNESKIFACYKNFRLVWQSP